MSTARAATTGYAPGVTVGAPPNAEALKYFKLWENHPSYRMTAPGEDLATVFLQHARPKPGASVIDFGCGTGRGALMLALLGHMHVTMLDFAGNCLDPEIRLMLTSQKHAMRFLHHDLEEKIPLVAEYGFCTDVMEHIPPAKVEGVLGHILMAAQHCFFSIATGPDNCGGLIGETLHLTQKPYAWWLKKFTDLDCAIHWSHDGGGECLFYVTAWQTGEAVRDTGQLNSTEEAILANVKHTIAQGWQQVAPHMPNELECMILGGGPSLNEFEAEIKQRRAEGVKLITLNGTYNWCLERGLVPSAQIMVDARELNKVFTKPVVDGCKYLLASQCHPAVFEDLPKDRTYIWHTTAPHLREAFNAQYGEGGWLTVPGGSTALLRAIPLFRMLGYRKFHLYGCDSCLADDKVHHAYAQPWNDSDIVLPITLKGSGRVFYGHTWMISQAQEFLDLIRFMGDEIELAVHGDGLLAHILNTGAQIEEG